MVMMQSALIIAQDCFVVIVAKPGLSLFLVVPSVFPIPKCGREIYCNNFDDLLCIWSTVESN